MEDAERKMVEWQRFLQEGCHDAVAGVVIPLCEMDDGDVPLLQHRILEAAANGEMQLFQHFDNRDLN